MQVVIGQYIHTDSWIHKLDPRAKLISLILLIITTFMINSLTTMLIGFGLTLVMIQQSKIPVKTFMKGILPLMFLLVFTVIFQVLLNQTGDIIYTFNANVTGVNIGIIVVLLVLQQIIKRKWRHGFILFLLLIGSIIATLTLSTPFAITVWEINVYSGGLEFALFLITRILILVSLSSLLTLTTKPTHLNNGLEEVMKPLKKIKVPTEEISMMISIALRFIPTLLDEANKIMKAQASRGVDFNEGSLKDKITQIISLLIPMFIISFKRADDLANAMEARGYAPGMKRTKYMQFEYRTIDYVVIAVAILLIPGVILLGL